MIDVRINSPPRFDAVPGPIPMLRFYFIVDSRGSQPTQTNKIYDVKPTISISGIDFHDLREESGLSIGDSLDSIGSREVKYLLPMPRHLLDIIESKRDRDVQISYHFEFRYLAFVTASIAAAALQPSVAYASNSFELSESKWLQLLEKMGYQSSWIIEVSRPRMEGWGVAMSFLDKASDRISSHDPEGAIAQCRAAWKSLDPILNAKWSSISEEIDRGSLKETGYPAKSERVNNMKEWVLKFAHTGDHPEHYAASWDDALLAYRTTVSLIAYLGKNLSEAEKRNSK